MKKLLGASLLASSLLLLPMAIAVPVFANPVDPSQPGPVVQPTPSDKSINLSFRIENPIKAQSVQELIERILKIVYLIGVPILVLFLLWAGFKFILARGDTTALGEARKNLLNVVIGAALFLGAYTIAQVIINTLKDTF